MSQQVLAREIIALSVAQEWAAARAEWTLDYIVESDTYRTCLCEHYPIVELCYLRNRRNGNSALVGNCCVNKFMGLPSGPIFAGLKRIKDNRRKALNEALTEYAYERGWITEWEREFCDNTRRRRILTLRQEHARQRINDAVLWHVRNQRENRT